MAKNRPWTEPNVGNPYTGAMANSRSGESVVQRLTRILQAFDAEHPRLTATELAERASLSLSTAHRLLQDMVLEGLLSKTDQNQYEIGLTLWELTQRSSFYQEFSQAAKPFLEGMHQTLDQNVSLAILDAQAGSIIYLERLVSHPDPADLTKIAGRLPVLSSAPGLAMVAFSPRHVQERYLAAAHRDRWITERGLTTDDLRRTLAQVRAEGYAHSRAVLHPRSSGTAAPVFGPQGKVQGALSVVVPVDQINLAVQVPVLRAAAHGLSQWISHSVQRPYREGPASQELS